jgi:hypothetical protein
MSDLTTQILIAVSAIVAIGGVVIIITSSQASQYQGKRQFDLILILGLSYLVAGLAVMNYIVGGLGLVFTTIGAIKRYRRK